MAAAIRMAAAARINATTTGRARRTGSQTFDSNGPNVKIRGNAYQVFERYVALAREAQSSGDRIAAENLYQHAEHYFRVMNAQGEGQGQGPPRPTTPADLEMGTGGNGEPREGEEAQVQPTRSRPLAPVPRRRAAAVLLSIPACAGMTIRRGP